MNMARQSPRPAAAQYEWQEPTYSSKETWIVWLLWLLPVVATVVTVVFMLLRFLGVAGGINLTHLF